MEKKIAVIRGDGIGPEIIGEAVAVLDAVAALYGHTFTYDEVIMGGGACDRWGDPLPPEMLQKCLDSYSVLLGAVGAQVERPSGGEAAGKGPPAPALRHGGLQQQPSGKDLAPACGRLPPAA